MMIQHSKILNADKLVLADKETIAFNGFIRRITSKSLNLICMIRGASKSLWKTYWKYYLNLRSSCLNTVARRRRRVIKSPLRLCLSSMLVYSSGLMVFSKPIAFMELALDRGLYTLSYVSVVNDSVYGSYGFVSLFSQTGNSVGEG